MEITAEQKLAYLKSAKQKLNDAWVDMFLVSDGNQTELDKIRLEVASQSVLLDRLVAKLESESK